MARARKQFPLRIPEGLYDVYASWAADEFRSVNAQMEAVLVDAARRAGRLRPPPGPQATPEDERGAGDPHGEA